MLLISFSEIFVTQRDMVAVVIQSEETFEQVRLWAPDRDSCPADFMPVMGIMVKKSVAFEEEDVLV
jgi:hypothetical protein